MRVIVFEKSGPWGSASYYLLEELSWFVLLLFLSLTGTFEGVRNAGLDRARGLRAEADRKVCGR